MKTETRKDSDTIDTSERPKLAYMPPSVAQARRLGEGFHTPDAKDAIHASPEALAGDVLAGAIEGIGNGAVRFGNFLRSLTAEGARDLFSLRPLTKEEKEEAGLRSKR